MPAARVARLWAERTPAEFTFDIKAFRCYRPPDCAIGIAEGHRRCVGSNEKKYVYYKDLSTELRRKCGRAFGWDRALEAIRQAGRRALPVRAVGCVSPQELRAHRALPGGAAGLPNQCRVSQQNLVRGQARSNHVGFRAQARTGQRDRRRASGEANYDSVGVGGDQPRSLDRPTARSKPRRGTGKGSSARRIASTTITTRGAAELGRQIESIAASSIHVVFNNNYEDQGQRNARTLMRMVNSAARST